MPSSIIQQQRRSGIYFKKKDIAFSQVDFSDAIPLRFPVMLCATPHEAYHRTGAVQGGRSPPQTTPKPAQALLAFSPRRPHRLASPFLSPLFMAWDVHRSVRGEQSPLLDSALRAVKKLQPCPSSAMRNDAAK
ncbi:hypothetical protein MUK42_29854 [Musa troglodytarum]|uniref:Uncharacterized protein n=1 Tax=Musa troglodytarum TaxID=320322 RepID=A0A9E7GHU7_9LILI|nr:hypothetical protein MUK42_29854 [Musa troglodytarum]